MHRSGHHDLPTTLTLAGMAEGVRLSLPLLPGILVFGLAVGATSAEKGLSLIESLFMSAFVYAGASQLVALQLWQDEWTFASSLAVVIVVLAINLRLVLMGAALQPWLSRLPPPTSYGALATLTDANFLLGSRYRDQGGTDAGIFIGCGLFLWVFWILATIPGHMAGHMVSDPKVFGLDLIMPIVFTAMAVSMFRLKRDRMVWPIAAGVALISAYAIEGFWFIVFGALAGSFAAGLLRERG